MTIISAPSNLDSRHPQRCWEYDMVADISAECYTAYLSARKSLLAGWIQAEIKSLDVVHSVLVELVSFISSLWGSSSVHVLVRLERDVASSNNYVRMNSIYIDHSSVQLKKNSSKLPKKVFLREKLTSLIFI